MYLIKSIRISRGQSLKEIEGPWEIARSNRKKEAKGLTRMQRNSLGELLLEKYRHYSYVFNYYEYEDYYIFLIEDLDGIVHEAHVFMVEENDN